MARSNIVRAVGLPHQTFTTAFGSGELIRKKNSDWKSDFRTLMSASQEFNVLKHLQKRKATDMAQIKVIINSLSAKDGTDEPAKKRVKFFTI